VAAIVDQLNVEAADGGGFAKHVCLELTGPIPGRLPAHCRIKRKDQPAASPGLNRGPKRFDLVDKAIDFGARGRSASLRWRLALHLARRRATPGAVIAHHGGLKPVPQPQLKVALPGKARNGW
jgi:hypothetical protein